MKKTLLIAAVGAALVTGPALVAHAEVKLYGHAHVSLDNLDRDNSADRGDMFVSDNSSRFGIRASEDLGGGLKGVAQYELLLGGEATGSATATGIDRTTSSPTTNRDNYLGVEGGFGALRLGVIDSATKDVGGIADLFYREQLGESRAIIHQGFWDGRVSSAVHYLSPTLAGGWSFKFQYGTEDSFTSDATTIALNARWTAGPLSLGVGYLTVDNPTSGASPSDTNGFRVGVKYDLGGGITLAGLFQSQSDAGFAAGADRDTWGLGASFKSGNNVFKAQWYQADELDNLANTGGDQLSLGWDHLFSKMTKGYVTYARTSNDSGATFGVGGNGHGETATPPAGRDASGFSIGMIVDF